MIQPTGQSLASIYAAQAVANPSSVQPTSAPDDPFKDLRGISVNGHAVDMNQLFTPSEKKTLENMKEFARANGMSENKIAEFDQPFIGRKMVDQTTPLSKDMLANQMRAIQEGYIKNNTASLTDYQKIYDNFHLFQGTDIRA